MYRKPDLTNEGCYNCVKVGRVNECMSDGQDIIFNIVSLSSRYKTALYLVSSKYKYYTTIVLRPFVRDYLGESVPEG